MSTLEPQRDFACASTLDRVSVAPKSKRKRERNVWSCLWTWNKISSVDPRKNFFVCVEYVDQAKKHLLVCPPDKSLKKGFDCLLVYGKR